VISGHNLHEVRRSRLAFQETRQVIIPEGEGWTFPQGEQETLDMTAQMTYRREMVEALAVDEGHCPNNWVFVMARDPAREVYYLTRLDVWLEEQNGERTRPTFEEDIPF
jgi:hypothetical protein